MTPGSGSEIVGVTGDFEGGWVQVNVSAMMTIGAGQWFTLNLQVDGANVTPANYPGWYQSGGNVSGTLTATVRVPNGRHRIGARIAAGAAPVAGSGNAMIDVVELAA
jgi:hypothetical protein